MANAKAPGEAVPSCPLCSGSGWRVTQRLRNERTVEEAVRCECVLGEYGQRLLRAAHIPPRYEQCDLASFEHEGHFRSLAKAYFEAQRFIEEYPQENAGLLLTGPIGSGKTHLAVSILKDLIATKSVGCLFYDYRELLKQIQNSYNDSVQVTEMDVLRPVFQAEVLVLDELGAAKPTEWVWDTVSHILNTRYNDKRTTIITTNYPDDPPAAVAAESSRSLRAGREETLGDRIGERMRSRLHEMCRVVRVEGEDFRLTIRKAR